MFKCLIFNKICLSLKKYLGEKTIEAGTSCSSLKKSGVFKSGEIHQFQIHLSKL